MYWGMWHLNGKVQCNAFYLTHFLCLCESFVNPFPETQWHQKTRTSILFRMHIFICSFKFYCMHAGKIHLGDAVIYRNLTILPLYRKTTGGELDYYSLKEGLANGTVEITEISEGGSVPNLKVKNSADKPVLILDGEELIGAKQNRIANTTILVKERCIGFLKRKNCGP